MECPCGTKGQPAAEVLGAGVGGGGGGETRTTGV